MSVKKNQQSQSRNPVGVLVTFIESRITNQENKSRLEDIAIYPGEVMLWTRRASKDILSIVRDIVVLGFPGFLVSRVVEFLEWREKIVKNLTFASAIRYVNQFSKEE